MHDNDTLVLIVKQEFTGVMHLVGCPMTGGGATYYPQNCANKPPVHTLQTLDGFKRPMGFCFTQSQHKWHPTQCALNSFKKIYC
jgi:hypothetical protein